MSLVSVSIAAPSTAEVGQTFIVEGMVTEGPAPAGLMFLGPIVGATVTIYQNGTPKGNATTNSVGYYSKSISINQAGTWGLRASTLGVWSDIAYITITEPPPPPPPPDIPTTLTIDAPETVQPDETFNISGILYETGTGTPVTSQPIDLSYNGVSLGNALTDIDGSYLLQASISTPGTYTLTASFAGSTTLGASQATSRLTTGGIELPSLAPLLAIALIALYIMKK